MPRFVLPFLLAAAVVHATAPDTPKDLKAFFLRTCATCHGTDGSGRAANGARLYGRNLADPKWQAKQKDSDLVKVIQGGKGAMPGFKAQLSEAETRQLVADVIRPLAIRK